MAIINKRYTHDEIIYSNSPENFNTLTDIQKENLCKWINATLCHRISINRKHTSYGMKHWFEHSLNGFYVQNGQFKGAMIECGFDKHTDGVNWSFCVTERSAKAASRKYRTTKDFEYVQGLLGIGDQ